MGNGSSVNPQANSGHSDWRKYFSPSNKSNSRESRNRYDAATSFRGKRSAVKLLLHTDGSRLAFMKYLMEQNHMAYLDFYFEVEELSLYSGVELKSRIRRIVNTYKQDEEAERHFFRHSMYHSKREVVFDIGCNIDDSVRDGGETDEDIENIIHHLKATQTYVLSILTSGLGAFQASHFYIEWEKSQMAQEKHHLNLQHQPHHTSTSHPLPHQSLESAPCADSKYIHAADMPKVLLVDDSHVISKVITLQLQRVGHEVTAVTNGRLGLEALQSKCFDIIIVDMFMPVVDGFEMVSCLKDLQTERKKRLHKSLISEINNGPGQGGHGESASVATNSPKKVFTMSSLAVLHPTSVEKEREREREDATTTRTKDSSFSVRPGDRSEVFAKSIHRGIEDHLGLVLPPTISDVIVVGMSADMSPQTRARAFSCGVDYFVEKPFDLDKLSAILQAAKEMVI